jgi:hypothetical protein
LIVTKHDGMSENVIINDISAGNNNKAYAEWINWNSAFAGVPELATIQANRYLYDLLYFRVCPISFTEIFSEHF